MQFFSFLTWTPNPGLIFVETEAVFLHPNNRSGVLTMDYPKKKQDIDLGSESSRQTLVSPIFRSGGRYHLWLNVSENVGSRDKWVFPKIMVPPNHPFGGFPAIFGNTQICNLDIPWTGWVCHMYWRTLQANLKPLGQKGGSSWLFSTCPQRKWSLARSRNPVNLEVNTKHDATSWWFQPLGKY